MKKFPSIWCLLLGVGMVGSFAANAAFARSHVGRGTIIRGELFGRIGLCWTDPTSSSGTSTSSSTDTASTNYGIVFAMEPGNGNEIAADIYSLDSSQRKVKQVGHADVTASNSNGSFTFAAASDSPGQFSLTLTPQDYSSGTPREHGSMSGTLTNAVLFSGDTASNIALKCDVADLNLLPEPAPSGSPTSSPTSSPTGSPTGSPSGIPTTSPTSSPTGSPTSTPIPIPSASSSTTPDL
jgi:hypothetical protein